MVINMKKVFALISILSVLIVTGCSKDYEKEVTPDELCHCNKIEECECKGVYQTITPSQAKDLIYNSNTFLIDVRSTAEYNGGHIDGAISIPLDEIENINLGKTLNLIVYCKSGSRSKSAAMKLLDLGYVNVYDLGSMDNWQ